MCVNTRDINSTILKRMYFWWSLCTLYLHACQVRVAVGDSGLCCCSCVTYFKHKLTPLCVGWFCTISLGLILFQSCLSFSNSTDFMVSLHVAGVWRGRFQRCLFSLSLSLNVQYFSQIWLWFVICIQLLNKKRNTEHWQGRAWVSV